MSPLTGATWRHEPFASFDTETTGVNVEEDRVVTATILKVIPGSGTPASRSWLVNPGIEIPDGAARIHGVTTEKAREGGMDPAVALVEILDGLREVWNSGQPVVIYNAPYDLTLMDRELKRYGYPGIGPVGPVIDPLVIDKGIDTFRPGSRKLIDTARHYGVVLTEADAHSSEGDTLAAARLAYKLGAPESGVLTPGRYNRPGRDTRGVVAGMTLEELVAAQVEWSEKQQRSFAEYKRITPQIGWPYRPEAKA
jgi:DNA polymerase-3 subunit epsilon